MKLIKHFLIAVNVVNKLYLNDFSIDLIFRELQSVFSTQVGFPALRKFKSNMATNFAGYLNSHLSLKTNFISN